MELTHIATRSGRLSSFLKDEMAMSSGLINRLKWQSRILVNGVPRHNDYTVAAGDTITALMDDPQADYPAQEGPLTILYEDEHLLALDKPAGMLIHPSRSCNEGTLANFVLGYYRARGLNCAFHPLTRLDRDTFGVVLLAKSPHVHAKLQQTPVEKVYRALVFGGPETGEGLIDAPIARKPLPSLLREVNPHGKPSQTHYRALEKGEQWSLLALTAITGRTHQLRLHCAYSGFPILGDPQYGTEESQAFSARLGLTSQALCAYSLTLTHPITGDALHIQTKFQRPPCVKGAPPKAVGD